MKLKEVLDWAKSQSLKPVEIDSETTSDYVGRNPILLSVLQGHRKCTALLHGFGYRIQEKRRKAFCNSCNSCEFSWNFFKMAKSYFENQICRYSEENQVQNLLDFKGYADPNYLSLAFSETMEFLTLEQSKATEQDAYQTQNEAANESLKQAISPVDPRQEHPVEQEGGRCFEVGGEDIHQSEIQRNQGQDFSDAELEDLQKKDPLRRAFDLAVKAEDLTNNFQGIVELKKNYGEMKEYLEEFAHSLLSQCNNQKEVAIIMKHNPEDDDDDDLDPEEQNWQKALYSRKKRFVGHPFYQVQLWNCLF